MAPNDPKKKRKTKIRRRTVYLDFDEHIRSKLNPLINAEIEKYLPKDSSKFSRMLRAFPFSEGKKIRPIIFLLAAGAFSVKNEEIFSEILPIAAAIEYNQAAFLVHDDIVDESDLRRGEPTAYKEFGKGQAITIGDYYFEMARKIVADSEKILGCEKANKILRELSNTNKLTGEGQSLDIDFQEEHMFNVTEEEYIDMIMKKTAYYTIDFPITAAAIVAGIKDDKLEDIKKFSLPAGIAFQIMDDCLDLEYSPLEDESNIGKKPCEDIIEGKITLPFIHLYKNCTEDERKLIEDLYLTDERSAVEAKHIWDLMKKYESIKYAKNVADRYYKQAKEYLDSKKDILTAGFCRDALLSTFEYLGNRKK